MFEPVTRDFDVPRLEQEIIAFWERNQIESLYLARNREALERFSFLDGPITANGPMGVHHAWGRTYKDLWQRYNTMLGKCQRYQNGFDGQGLWVEVTVERELSFTSKRDIEAYGIANFVRRCKESVFAFADLQTRQSQRLGYFMDWSNSYYTLSDENNFMIWHFLKRCHERGLIYHGTDVMPWCTRCATGLSEHEIVTEGYQEVTHQSLYVRLPLTERSDEYLLVWTTTPWTLTSNVAVAVHPGLPYLKVRQKGDIYYLARGALPALDGPAEVLDELPGSALVGLRYRGPYAQLPAGRDAQFVVIPWSEVSEAEGTGLVHIAPGCGKEDFALGKEHGLAIIAPIDQFGVFADGFGPLTGHNVHEAVTPVAAQLEDSGLLYRQLPYTHRYPTCWRCGTELVFRLVDEWFISMGPLRKSMMELAQQVRWIPEFGLDRELDWLRNMDDWMISKKRYWGLALPFWLCEVGHLQVIGSREELLSKAIRPAAHLESPHRPWIDEIALHCPECGGCAQRIPDVGNVWLDAGIVPFSTLKYRSDRRYWAEWFPADFITESFPGQFRNWFYSLLAMSTVLEGAPPIRTVLGHGLVRDQEGREMHKSWGNSIPFDEAANRAGADVMRWLFCTHNPETNISFGWEALDTVKRRLLTLWNTYSFFVTYANVDRWTPSPGCVPMERRPLLDRWIVARLNQLISEVRSGLDGYNASDSATRIDEFVEDLSTWYVRQSRRRFWKSENDLDKSAAYETLYQCLTVLARLTAPFLPFLTEHLYQNLVRRADDRAPLSVHLTDYPAADVELVDEDLLKAMSAAQRVVALGRAARDRAGIKVRQPLATIYVRAPNAQREKDILRLRDLILAELNVRSLQMAATQAEFVSYGIRPNLPVLGPQYGRKLPVIQEALSRLDPLEVASALERGESVSLSLGDATLTLSGGELLVEAREREGYKAMAGEGYVVVLDTTLTPELIEEGLVREVVRRINDWRKAARFSVADRISVRYEASPRLSAAIEEHRPYISQEILATSVREGGLWGSGFRADARFDGEQLRVKLTHP